MPRNGQPPTNFRDESRNAIIPPALLPMIPASESGNTRLSGSNTPQKHDPQHHQLFARLRTRERESSHVTPPHLTLPRSGQQATQSRQNVPRPPQKKKNSFGEARCHAPLPPLPNGQKTSHHTYIQERGRKGRKQGETAIETTDRTDVHSTLFSFLFPSPSALSLPCSPSLGTCSRRIFPPARDDSHPFALFREYAENGYFFPGDTATA